MLAIYRELIALRRAEPELADPRLDRVEVDFDEEQRLAGHAPRLAAGHRQLLRRRRARARSRPARCCFATGPVDSAVDWLQRRARTAVIARAR